MAKQLTEAEKEALTYGSRFFAGTFWHGHRVGCAGGYANGA